MRPFTIVSLWEMLETSGAAWWLASSTIGQSLIRLETGTNIEGAKNIALALALVYQEASRLEMRSSLAQIGHIQRYLDSGKCSFVYLRQMMHELAQRVKDELDWQVFVGIEARHLSYYKPDIPLFGKSVFERFPSANDDIDEAGKCLALGRGTACVMHLMRAAEVGLLVLAKEVGVTNKNDWGSYLRE